MSRQRGRSAIQGTITRGTTHPNRLRRIDAWLLHHHASLLRPHGHPWAASSDEGDATGAIVADVGFGASPVTTKELWARCASLAPTTQVIGFDVDPGRVATAQQADSAHQVAFRLGGFEVPLPADARACVIRAANVLRQYEEQQVAQAWALLQSRLCAAGIALDITCDELGRLATWVALNPHGPQTFTLAASLRGLQWPSDLAPRLVKSLIHHNVPGTAVHRFLSEFDSAWASRSHLKVHGRRQWWVATVAALKQAGWPIVDRPTRWRHGEVTVAWEAVAPPRES